jgi:hypothetical protein
MAFKDLLKTHRTWEDGVGLMLGLMIGLSPWFYEEPVVPVVVLNSGLVGLAVLALAQLELVRLRRGKRLRSSPAVFGCRPPPSSSTMPIRTIYAYGIGHSARSFQSLPCSNSGKIGDNGTSGERTAITSSSRSISQRSHMRLPWLPRAKLSRAQHG